MVQKKKNSLSQQIPEHKGDKYCRIPTVEKNEH